MSVGRVYEYWYSVELIRGPGTDSHTSKGQSHQSKERNNLSAADRAGGPQARQRPRERDGRRRSAWTAETRACDVATTAHCLTAEHAGGLGGGGGRLE